MKKRRIQFTREEKGIFIMIALLLFNIVSHLIHPAYRYYRNYSAVLDKKFDDFRNEVRNDFIPSVALFASNILNRTSAGISLPSLRPSVSSLSSRPVEARSDIQQTELAGRFFSFCGRSYLDYYGHFLTVGDDLDGTRIISISPLCVVTSRQSYLLKNENQQKGVLNVAASN